MSQKDLQIVTKLFLCTVKDSIIAFIYFAHMNPLRLNLKFLISSRLKVTILLLSNLRYRACGRNNLPSLAFTYSTYLHNTAVSSVKSLV